MSNKVVKYKRAMDWIRNNTIDGNGIVVTSKERMIYPEVTGYYIPSLLQWGERDLARSYAEYLCSIQKTDGSWYDNNDRAPYVFDTAQILKGLLAIRKIFPEVDECIKKGCDWIISNMQSNGRLTTPSKDAWGCDDYYCSELIHIYCLSPVKEAGVIFDRADYIEAAERILTYYMREKIDRIRSFSLLSHFYAYVMEGLYDLGEIELCRECMLGLEKYRNKKGGIPGLNDVPWVCSTGMFQLALVWYKLGDLNRGNSLFYNALSLQNRSGGWYGSYHAPGFLAHFYTGRRRPYYFPNAEISWANKYFMDSLAIKEKLEFEKQAPTFMDNIDENDGRYVLIRTLICDEQKRLAKSLSICDIGCGKGRYIKRLIKDMPSNYYYVSDLSEKVMEGIGNVKEKRVGSITNTGYEDNCFDLVYACEVYEHAINLHGAFAELHRITKPGGKLVIIDKPKEKLGQLKIYEWEQWIDDADIKKFCEEFGCRLEIRESVPYEGKDDGLFRAWIGTKND